MSLPILIGRRLVRSLLRLYTGHRRKALKEYLKRLYCAVVSVQETFNHSGDNGEGDPPVLIPNTEVKPFSADGTWLDTTWESRTLPVPIKEKS